MFYELESFPREQLFNTNENDLGKVFYREMGKSIIVAGDPEIRSSTHLDLKQIELKNQCLKLFSESLDQSKKLCGYYFSFPPVLNQTQAHKFGQSYECDLKSIKLNGKEGTLLRRSLNKGKRESFSILRLEEGMILPKNCFHLEREWLKKKRLPKIQFLLQRLPQTVSAGESFFLLYKENQLIAIVSIYQKKQRVATIHHLIRSEKGANLSLDYLLTELLLSLKKRGEKALNFGFVPFLFHSEATSWWESFLKIGGYDPFFYKAQSLANFKRKFCHSHEDRYLLLDAKGISSFLSLCRVSFFGNN